MATRHALPRVDLRHGTVPQLPATGPGHLEPQSSDLLEVQQPVTELVSERLATAPHERPTPPRAELHIALIVKDRATYDLLKRNAYLIKPPYWDGEVKLRFIIGKPSQAQSILLRIALVELGMVDPIVAQIAYPDQASLGWTDTND